MTGVIVWHYVPEGSEIAIGACGAPLKFSQNYTLKDSDSGGKGCSFPPGVSCDNCKVTVAYKEADAEYRKNLIHQVDTDIPDPEKITVTKDYAETHTVKQSKGEHLWHSPSCGWDNMPEFDNNITVPKIPILMITDGENSSMFDDRFKGPAPDSIPPIVLATYIARLRALADILESS